MNNKNIFSVRSCFWKVNVEVDDFYDDKHAEACTRAVELLIKNRSSKEIEIGPVLLCKQINEQYEKTYNSYKILNNSGYPNYANVLRNKFLKETRIDLNKESLSST